MVNLLNTIVKLKGKSKQKLLVWVLCKFLKWLWTNLSLFGFAFTMLIFPALNQLLTACRQTCSKTRNSDSPQRYHEHPTKYQFSFRLGFLVRLELSLLKWFNVIWPYGYFPVLRDFILFYLFSFKIYFYTPPHKLKITYIFCLNKGYPILSYLVCSTVCSYPANWLKMTT